MIQIQTWTFGSYQTNCYLVQAAGSTGCCLIDPGSEAPVILEKLAALGLTLDAILLTHGHFDHVGAVEELVEATGCRLWMEKSDWVLPIDPLTTRFFPLSNCDFTEISFFEDQDILSAGGLSFQCLKTPGHTPGSTCFLVENTLFSGDTLFAGSCGRTDFPGGSGEEMRHSLQRLAALNGNITVFPGHGPATTLERERATNPYLQ